MTTKQGLVTRALVTAALFGAAACAGGAEAPMGDGAAPGTGEGGGSEQGGGSEGGGGSGAAAGWAAPTWPGTVPEFAPEDPDLPTLIAVAAGNEHSCALRSDGAVFCWGANDAGQLGNGLSGSGTDSTTPVAVVELDDAIAIAAGNRTTCAVKSDQTVVCWGYNGQGELGNGMVGVAESSSTPVAVIGLGDALEIACGVHHTCARRTGGGVFCWGSGDSGQLGDGGNVDSATPVSVSGLDDAGSLTGGYAHTCVLRSSGDSGCWGVNTLGRLGDGTTENSNVPVTGPNLEAAASIAAGAVHTCVARKTGPVVCWGDNSHGELGDGTFVSTLDAVAVIGINDAVAVTAGTNHACALRADASVSCWGLNNSGQLGAGSDVWSSATFLPVAGLSEVAIVEAGDYHTCALTADGHVLCWGSNYRGQLGSGNVDASTVPVEVTAFP